MIEIDKEEVKNLTEFIKMKQIELLMYEGIKDIIDSYIYSDVAYFNNATRKQLNFSQLKENVEISIKILLDNSSMGSLNKRKIKRDPSSRRAKEYIFEINRYIKNKLGSLATKFFATDIHPNPEYRELDSRSIVDYLDGVITLSSRYKNPNISYLGVLFNDFKLADFNKCLYLSRKYTLDKTNTKIVNGKILYKVILANREVVGLNGSNGGYVQSYNNLSQFGTSIVFGSACVLDNAEVKCNARVGNNCVIYGDAIISGKSILGDSTEVGGFSVITGNAFLFGNIKIEGYSVLDGDVSINGNCHIINSKIIGDNIDILHATKYSHIVDNNEGFSCDISGNDINITDSYIKGSAYNSTNIRGLTNIIESTIESSDIISDIDKLKIIKKTLRFSKTKNAKNEKDINEDLSFLV